MTYAGYVQQVSATRHCIDLLCPGLGSGAGRWREIMVDSLVVVIHGYRQYLLGQFLTDDVPIEVLHDLLRWWRWLPLAFGLCILDGLLGVHFAEDHEEVMAFLTLDEPRRADERFNVGAWIATLWTGQDILLVWRFLTVTIFATTASRTGRGRASTAGPGRCVRTIL